MTEIFFPQAAKGYSPFSHDSFSTEIYIEPSLEHIVDYFIKPLFVS